MREDVPAARMTAETRDFESFVLNGIIAGGMAKSGIGRRARMRNG
jgi:hypothetical protein